MVDVGRFRAHNHVQVGRPREIWPSLPSKVNRCALFRAGIRRQGTCGPGPPDPAFDTGVPDVLRSAVKSWPASVIAVLLWVKCPTEVERERNVRSSAEKQSEVT